MVKTGYKTDGRLKAKDYRALRMEFRPELLWKEGSEVLKCLGGACCSSRRPSRRGLSLVVVICAHPVTARVGWVVGP